MRRVFWLAAGLGAGVAAALLVSRWLRRQQQRFAPSAIGAQISEGARDLARLVRDSIEVGRREMERKEEELRGSPPE